MKNQYARKNQPNEMEKEPWNTHKEVRKIFFRDAFWSVGEKWHDF